MTSVPHHIEAGEAERAIVFLHGIGGNCHSFDAQLDYFAAHGWRAVAWDMPGYGASAPLGPEMTWGGLAEAAVRLLDHLGLEAPVVVGHSMGGMVAQELAIGHPGRVGALVLSATSDVFGSADGKFQEKFLAERLAPWLENGGAFVAVGALHLPGEDGLVELLQQQGYQVTPVH